MTTSQVGGASPATIHAGDLYAIGYSPWSERAQWALDYHGHSYDRHEYLPMISEPLVRLRTRRLGGRITVPLLIAEGGAVIMDSLDIALHADVLAKPHLPGAKPALIPPGRRAEVERFTELAEHALVTGRGRVTPTIIADREARLESVPRLLRWAAGPLTAIGGLYFDRKYNTHSIDHERARQATQRACEVLEEALEKNGDFVLGAFGYADIAMATMLQLVEPVHAPTVKLGPGMRRCWRDDKLAKRFSALVAWRDALYRDRR